MGGCRALKKEEVERVAQSFAGRYATRDKALFVLGVKSGFRISELLSLTVGDVYRAGRVVDVVHVAAKKMKGKTDSRSVRLNDDAREALAPWIAELLSAGYNAPGVALFRSRRGINKPISRRQALGILQGAFAANGLEGVGTARRLGTHSMRKTFATRVYEKMLERVARGQAIDPLRETSKRLGHRSVEVTERYLDWDPYHLDDVILEI